MPEPIVVTAVSWLLSGSGSGVVEVTVAVLAMLPYGTFTLTTIVTVAEPPTAIVPRSAVTVPFVPTAGPAQVPGLAAHERKVVPGGSGSLRMTAAAGSGPRLTTLTVYVSGWPGVAGLLPAVLDTIRSAPVPAGGVGVFVGVPVTGVAVRVAVGVAVGVADAVAVAVAVTVAVPVGVSVAVGVRVAVPVAVGVAVEVGVAVAVRVPVGVCVGVSVGVLVGVLVGVFVGVLVGVSVGVLVGV